MAAEGRFLLRGRSGYAAEDSIGYVLSSSIPTEWLWVNSEPLHEIPVEAKEVKFSFQVEMGEFPTSLLFSSGKKNNYIFFLIFFL